MTEQPSSADSHSEILELKNQIREWALGIRIVFVVINVLPLYFCTRALLVTPSFKVVFYDMLGSLDKFPPFTLFVMRMWLPLLGAVWLLASLAVFLIFTLRQPRYVWITAVVSVFFFSAAAHLATIALMAPMIEVVRNLSGGGM
ncbi:MAG: hypothetical protein ACO1TE_20705 [Prosthecobacter sp.]